MSTEESKMKHLELAGFVGFNGKIMNGVKSHPNKSHVLYPAGNKIVVRNMNKRDVLFFLSGHCNAVSCLTVSNTGKYVAAGQLTHMVNKTEVIVWDFDQRTKLSQHSYHKGKVQDINISCSELYLGSIGGLDDGNVVIVSLTKMEPIVVAPTTLGNPSLPVLIRFSNFRDQTFVTAGKDTLRVWELDVDSKQLFPFNTQFGHVKRDICCAVFDLGDKFIYCGTLTGDMVKIRLNMSPSPIKPNRMEYTPVLTNSVVRKMPKHTLMEVSPDCLSSDGFYVQGITAIEMLKNGNLIFGTGDGVICHATEECITEKGKPLLGKPSTREVIRTGVYLNEIERVNVHQSITSMSLRGEGHQFYVGTKTAEMYLVNLMDLTYDLLSTSHSGPIKQVIFTPRSAELFASCGENIRIWSSRSMVELLRINIPNMTCNCISFSPDGQSIVSGWDDGKIRVFTPETGKLIYTIPNAHMRGVSAIQVTSDCKQLVSGGAEGSVRVWELSCKVYKMKGTMQEHRSAITSVIIRNDDAECITSSVDGYCIIWDMRRLLRVNTIFSNTMFMCVCYHPSESQVLACGTNRKITYWETYDAQQVRELEGADSGTVTVVHVSENGKSFVSGGTDRLVKLWKYDDGEISHVSSVHSSDVNSAKISPGQKYIIAGCEDGSLFMWNHPIDL